MASDLLDLAKAIRPVLNRVLEEYKAMEKRLTECQEVQRIDGVLCWEASGNPLYKERTPQAQAQVAEDCKAGDIRVLTEVDAFEMWGIPGCSGVLIHDGVQWLALPPCKTPEQASDLGDDLQRVIESVRTEARKVG